jgi:hypothetical protein
MSGAPESRFHDLSRLIDDLDDETAASWGIYLAIRSLDVTIDTEGEGVAVLQRRHAERLDAIQKRLCELVGINTKAALDAARSRVSA